MFVTLLVSTIGANTRVLSYLKCVAALLGVYVLAFSSEYAMASSNCCNKVVLSLVYPMREKSQEKMLLIARLTAPIRFLRIIVLEFSNYCQIIYYTQLVCLASLYFGSVTICPQDIICQQQGASIAPGREFATVFVDD